MRGVIKYPGSKWSLASWIISLFPEHHSYVEPFFGSGAVLFSKERSDIETVNDLDGEVVNFFDCIRHDPEKLSRAVYYTPYSRSAYESACEAHTDDKFERARLFCIRMNMGYGFRTNGSRVGWKIDTQGRERAYAARDWAVTAERIMEAAERLRGVQIEQRPAVEVIERFNFPNVLVYCDPPYILDTRYGKQYACEMDKRNHIELLEVLKAHKGPAIISGYDNNIYNDVLHEWHRETNTSRTQSGVAKQEVLWMNYHPQNMKQVTITDFLTGGWKET